MKRRGELSFEGILGVAFISVILATALAVAQFYKARNPADPENHDITASYNIILTTLREDAQTAAVAEIASDSLTLYNSQSDLISRYAFIGGNLQRFDKSEKGEILLKGVESVFFKTGEDLPNLLTVKIMPADRMDIPFFTSFALRGINHDLN